jgi:hypothetical protein
MSVLLANLKTLLNEYGQSINSGKTIVEVNSTGCIDTQVPTLPGVYWIETTMPVDVMRAAISEVLEKEKRVRKTPPQGTKLIEQRNSEFYVAYSGTEDDLRKRLKQHLFNQGHADTVKLGCVIDEYPFSQYRWRIGFAVIDSYEFRYAVEAWWRLNIGWPPFCLR